MWVLFIDIDGNRSVISLDTYVVGQFTPTTWYFLDSVEGSVHLMTDCALTMLQMDIRNWMGFA